LLPAYRAEVPAPRLSQKLEWREHPGGGRSPNGHDGADFAFDNEAPRHQVLLRPFRIAARAVSNGEYQAFIADGGYRRPEFWLSDGWAQVRDKNWEAPLYWLKDDDGSESIFTYPVRTRLDPPCTGRACQLLRSRRS